MTAARRPLTPRKAALTLLIIALAVIAAFPLVWMVLSSLKTPQESMQVPPVWLPASPNFEAFAEVSDVIDAGRSMLNSAIIATTATIGILITSLMAGYAFAKYRFKGRDMLFAIMISTMFLPPIVTLIPLYRIVSEMGLAGTLMGVVLPQLGNAFGIFLMRQFIAGVPDDLIDAARVDGASELRIVFTVVAPAIVPAIAALALFAFTFHWNTYLWPLTVLQGNSDNYPIVLSLGRLLSYNRGAMNSGLVMAGATLAVLPPLLLFVFLQRFFVDSMVSAGVKG
jgi:multiple sugar transport system permease protein